MTKICPYCQEERQARGFHFHEIACRAKRKLNPIKERYAIEIENMRPEQAEKFLRKAAETAGG